MALSINPSYRWEGNDGPWSTFDLRVGTPPQLVRVLPSSSGSEVWVVHPQGCNNKSVADCSERRGGLFQWNSSTTFDDLSEPDQKPYFELNFDAEEALGYNGSALVGVDTVALGGEGDTIPALESQVAAVFAVTFPFMGQLGLKARNATIVNENDQHESILGALKSNGEVKSHYWAYTAGAPYRAPEGKQYGSLTFGGWDKKRGDLEHGLTVPFGTQQDLIVSVIGITLDTVSGPVSTGGLPISVYIDSMVPDIWLPVAACNTFESAFGLVWNDTSSRYHANDTDTLKMRNPNITFSLAESDEAHARSIDIVLPYLAFDLTTDAGGYFPLRRADNESQYFIGRTFLQEAYLAVNYDRSEFTLAQATFPAGNDERDVVVFRHKRKSGLNKGAIAGICIGAIIAVAIILGRLLWLWRQKRKARERRWAAAGLPAPGQTAFNDKSDDLRGWIKPIEGYDLKADDVKPELDANATARCVASPHRHELGADEVDLRASTPESLGSDDQSPAELDGAETLVGDSAAVSPLQDAEVLQSPLPMGYPSPMGHDWLSTEERRPSLGRLKAFFHELQSASEHHDPGSGQQDSGAEMSGSRQEVGDRKSLVKEERLED